MLIRSTGKLVVTTGANLSLFIHDVHRIDLGRWRPGYVQVTGDIVGDTPPQPTYDNVTAENGVVKVWLSCTEYVEGFELTYALVAQPDLTNIRYNTNGYFEINTTETIYLYARTVRNTLRSAWAAYGESMTGDELELVMDLDPLPSSGSVPNVLPRDWADSMSHSSIYIGHHDYWSFNPTYSCTPHSGAGHAAWDSGFIFTDSSGVQMTRYGGRTTFRVVIKYVRNGLGLGFVFYAHPAILTDGYQLSMFYILALEMVSSTDYRFKLYLATGFNHSTGLTLIAQSDNLYPTHITGYNWSGYITLDANGDTFSASINGTERFTSTDDTLTKTDARKYCGPVWYSPDTGSTYAINMAGRNIAGTETYYWRIWKRNHPGSLVPINPAEPYEGLEEGTLAHPFGMSQLVSLATGNEGNDYVKPTLDDDQQPQMEIRDVFGNLQDTLNLQQTSGDEPTGFPNTTDSTLSWSDANRRLSIAGTYDYYINNIKYSKSGTDTVDITDMEGMWYIYYNGTTLTASQVSSFPSYMRDYALVAMVYWDAANNKGYVSDERHGLMPWQTHYNLHIGQGALFVSGMALGNFTDGDGSLASHAQHSIATGKLLDEDLETTRTAKTTTGNLVVAYRDGSGYWRWQDSSAPIITTGTGRAAICPTAGGLTEVDNNKFLLAHIFATPDISGKYFAIIGTTQYNSILEAREGSGTEVNTLSTVGLPSKEFVYIGCIVYQTSDSYANTWKSRVRPITTGVYWADFRYSKISSGAAPAAHSNLSGLTDADSHPASAVGVDASGFSGNLSASDTDVQTALDTLDAVSLTPQAYFVDEPGALIDGTLAAWIAAAGTIDAADGLVGTDPDSDMTLSLYVDSVEEVVITWTAGDTTPSSITGLPLALSGGELLEAILDSSTGAADLVAYFRGIVS